MDIEQEINHIKYRMDLLFNGTELDRLLYEHNITKEQDREIRNYFRELNEKLNKGEDFCSAEYEKKIEEICNGNQLVDHHFAEMLARCIYEEDSYREVAEKLYSDSINFSRMLEE